jgi:hypothetical protein
MTEPTPPPRPAPMKQPVTMDSAPLSPPPPSRSPDAADLAFAKVAVPWMELHQNTPPHPAGNAKLAEALAAWLTARGIY